MGKQCRVSIFGKLSHVHLKRDRILSRFRAISKQEVSGPYFFRRDDAGSNGKSLISCLSRFAKNYAIISQSHSSALLIFETKFVFLGVGFRDLIFLLGKNWESLE